MKINKVIFIFVLFFLDKVYADYCFDIVAEKYSLSKELIMAISLVESNMDNRVINTSNSDGSQDFCHMQINSQWSFLFNFDLLLEDACYCTAAGAWILKDCISRYGDSWRAVACYNTGRGLETRSHQGQNYIKKVKKTYEHLIVGGY